MKTRDEIISKIALLEHTDIYGVQRMTLVNFLPYSDAQHHPIGEFKEEDWKPIPNTTEAITKEIINLLPTAWNKANQEIGLASKKNIDQFEILFWLLGDNDFLADLNKVEYTYYGKAKLELISNKVEFDWKKLDNKKRSKDNE